MNRARVVVLLRELLEEFEREDPPASRPPRVRREPRTPPEPPTELEMKRAEANLLKLGYRHRAAKRE